MQSDVPPLPISCLTNNLRSRRTNNFEAKPAAVDSDKTTSVSRITNLTSKTLLQRNKLRTVLAGGSSPYKSSARFHTTDTANKTSDKSAIDQRVSSAKMLRVKQLQNQLADAHFHLNELSNENKLLKAIQKRQDAALKRYEGTNAELPRIINTHHEDLRVLQSRYKKLKSQYNRASDTLKEKDNELHSLQAQNKKLAQLSKDRRLGERDQLQTQVFDLTHRINEQDDTIQTLKRKLELETKYLKHQLHVEMVKHKECQKELEETQTKLQQLERLNEQRLKRSYQASQLTYYSRGRASVTSQSLTNLSDAQSENPFKLPSFRKLLENESTTNQSLPSLHGASSTPSRSQGISTRTNLDTPGTTTEALASLESSRSFRLLRSPVSQKPTPLSTSRSTAKDFAIEENAQNAVDVEKTQGKLDTSLDAVKTTYELPQSLEREFESSIDDDTSNKDTRSNANHGSSDSFSYASRSRSLHARLVNSASDGVRANKTTISSRSRSLTKENLENIAEYDREVKYDRDSVVTVISKETLSRDDVGASTNGSNSDIESDVEIPVAYDADEDEDARRQSDLITEDVDVRKQSNASSNLSSLFTHLRKPPNYPLGCKKTEDQPRLNFDNVRERTNGLTLPAERVIDDITDTTVLLERSLSQSVDLFAKGKDNGSETSGHRDNDVATSAEQLLDDITENLRETIHLENSMTVKSMSNDKSQNKSRCNNSKKSELKNTLERNTEDNDSTNKAFDKAKLLAAMKAIDDNENIEFVDQKSRRNSASNRMRITENLYRGLPTHKKKSDLLKELFSDAKLDNKDEN